MLEKYVITPIYMGCAGSSPNCGVSETIFVQESSDGITLNSDFKSSCFECGILKQLNYQTNYILFELKPNDKNTVSAEFKNGNWHLKIMPIN